jgi:anti-sigma B factor antagonist
MHEHVRTTRGSHAAALDFAVDLSRFAMQTTEERRPRLMNVAAPGDPAPPDDVFAVETQLVGRTVRVVVRGELDLATVGILKSALRSVWSRDVRDVEIDLRALTFMGSAGVAAFLEANARARDIGCTLTLVRGPPAVHRVFELTGIERQFTFCAAARSGPLRLVR